MDTNNNITQTTKNMTEEEIFEPDLLKDRKAIAKRIESIIEANADNQNGFVLSINGEWGTGKTTFANMLTEYLKIKNYRVISFNCWKNDFVDDPLVSLFAQMSNVLGKDKFTYNKILPVFEKIMLGGLVGGAKAVIGKPADFVEGVLTGALDSVKDLGEKYLESYNSQIESMEKFKSYLREYVADIKNNDTKNNVVFIIDELDRCNPHYAVKVLERIKYLFDIPNVFFILPISRSQLECAIKGFYGSDLIDANMYLRKFIDLEIDLPIINLEEYCESILKNHCKLNCLSDVQEEMYHQIKETSLLFEGLKTDLRSIEKIMYRVNVAMTTPTKKTDAYMPILLMSYIKFNHRKLYSQICNHDLSTSELLNELEQLFPTILINRDNNSTYKYLLKLVTYLLYLYDIESRNGKRELPDEIKQWDIVGDNSPNRFKRNELLEEYKSLMYYSPLHQFTIDYLRQLIDTSVISKN